MKIHVLSQNFLYNRPKMTVWWGIVSGRIEGSFNFSETIDAEWYLMMLRDEILPVVNTWEKFEDLNFMYDSAIPHFALIVGEWLNGHYPRGWLSQCGQLGYLIYDHVTFFFGVLWRNDFTPQSQQLWKNLQEDYNNLFLPSHWSFWDQLMWFPSDLLIPKRMHIQHF